MIRFILIFGLCLTLLGVLNGCTTVGRLTDLRNKNVNTVTIKIPGKILETKKLIREVAKEMNLVEAVDAETENFMLFTYNIGNSMLMGLVVSPLASMDWNRLGVFLKYDKDNNITIIDISEEKGTFAKPKREKFAERIKQRLNE